MVLSVFTEVGTVLTGVVDVAGGATLGSPTPPVIVLDLDLDFRRPPTYLDLDLDIDLDLDLVLLRPPMEGLVVSFSIVDVVSNPEAVKELSTTPFNPPCRRRLLVRLDISYNII